MLTPPCSSLEELQRLVINWFQLIEGEPATPTAMFLPFFSLVFFPEAGVESEKETRECGESLQAGSIPDPF